MAQGAWLCVVRIVSESKITLALAAAALVMVAAGVSASLDRAPRLPHLAMRPVSAPARPVNAAPPVQPSRQPPEAFQADLGRLARSFPGDVGVAVFDVNDGWIASWQGDRPFPQQSVSKLWVAVGLLDEVDRGLINLSQNLTIGRQDLSVFSEPIQVLVKPTFTTTLGDLLVRAIRDSDNAANDLLIRAAGGVRPIQATLASKGVDGVRLGMDEKHLQAVINGLVWKPEFAGTSALSLERARLPMAKREATLANYVSNPIDGATPVGTVEGLAALSQGKLLSPESTQRLIGIMDIVRTGRHRLKGGLERGWMLAHKTGTGPNLAGASVGINDVGLLTAPDGHTYAVAVFIAHTRAGTPERLAFMQRAAELVEASWSGSPPPAALPPAKAGEAAPPASHGAGHHRRRVRHHRRHH